MDRQQAVQVMKEILEQCYAIEGRSLTLLPPRNNDALSDTFQIHIRTDDSVLTSCIRDIATKHGLSTFQDKTDFVVYKPHPELQKK